MAFKLEKYTLENALTVGCDQQGDRQFVKSSMGKRKAQEKTTSRPASGRALKLEDRVCPCCHQARPMNPDTAPLRIELLAATHRQDMWNHFEPGFSVNRADEFMQWACDECLASGRAVEAKPWLHGGYAIFAYVDQARNCEDCGQDFVFSASEQAYWYETLQFFMYAMPNQCTGCRRKRRKTKGVHRELEHIHAKFGGSIAELIYLADLYLELGNAAKALEHLRRAKNKTRSPELRDQLLVRIAKLEPPLV
jgi:Probable zinc-ribbon domain